MRGVTIIVAIVVGLTWALTLCDAEPSKFSLCQAIIIFFIHLYKWKVLAYFISLQIIYHTSFDLLDRILNPFRNRGKQSGDGSSGPMQNKFDGKFPSTQRFGRQLDDKFLLIGRMARRANGGGESRKNKIADEKWIRQKYRFHWT